MDNKILYSKITRLLNKCATIAQELNTQFEEAFKRGEYFNIFKILNLKSDETRLHSAFIGELLDPKGSHGLNNGPLDKFLKLIFKDDFNMSEDSQVMLEYYIGKKNNSNTEGGRIDILIRDGSKVLVIENKINAKDQENQLLRYHNFIKDKNHKLIYLTLFGDMPSEFSTGNKLREGEDYCCISYKDTILTWFNECRHLAIDNQNVLIQLNLYIETLKSIIQNKMTMDENFSLMELMASDIEATSLILENSEKFKKYMISEYFLKPLKEWCKKKNLEINISENLIQGVKGSTIKIFEKGWKNHIAIVFETSNFRDLWYGISYIEKIDKSKLTQDMLVDPSWYDQNEYWPHGSKWFDEYRNIDFSVLKDLKDYKIYDYVIDQISNLYEVIKGNPEKYMMS